jgi:hypothetical protein
MNSFFQILAPRAFSLIFAASVAGLAACSTGTEPGETNVEEGDVKDKDPNAMDRGGENTSNTAKTHQDTINALMDTAKVENDPYERSKKTPHTETHNDKK